MARPRVRVLIFIVAYEAEKTIGSVLRRIPLCLAHEYDLECLVIDDSSSDRTFEASRSVEGLGFPVKVLYNPVNQGYGGNQKIGYHYAIENGFDYVGLLHGDGQYAPEALGDLLEAARSRQADAVFGSRMMEGSAALRGGMPLYKFVGNRILTGFENALLGTRLSEFHSGYRVYSIDALRRLPFDLNSNGFHFDTEIIVQLVVARLTIVELPIPTYYGDEICRVNGLAYAFQVAKAVIKARLQELGIFYDRRFDCAPAKEGNTQYQMKIGYESPHTLALERVERGASVLDLGCAGGYMAKLLREQKNCRVTGVDAFPLADAGAVDEFILHDLNAGFPSVDLKRFDYVLMLDVVEHLSSPESFVDEIRRIAAISPDTRIIVSTGNVAFLITRCMLLLGQFNYGKRGILDLTHTRLFTFATIRRLFAQGGFRVVETRGVPGPFPLALGYSALSRLLVRLNRLAIAFSKGLFSYQIFMVLEPLPSLELLLKRAEGHADILVSAADDRGSAESAEATGELIVTARRVRRC